MSHCRTRPLPFALLAAAAIAVSGPASAADYFAGKTIEWTVGADVGGGYDIYSRTIAKHLPKYIPGNPLIVVKNLPGAGSAKAATFIAQVAPKDGTAIGSLMPGGVMARCSTTDRSRLTTRPSSFISPPPTRAPASVPPSSIPRPRLLPTRRGRRP